jgi:hypothetical protein
MANVTSPAPRYKRYCYTRWSQGRWVCIPAASRTGRATGRRKRQVRFLRALTIAMARSTSSHQMRAVQATKYRCPGILLGQGERLRVLTTRASIRSHKIRCLRFSRLISATLVSDQRQLGLWGRNFSSFLLQPGIYQINLSGIGFAQMLLSNTFPQTWAFLNYGNPSAFGSVGVWLITPNTYPGSVNVVDLGGGDRLVQVVNPNTTLSFVNELGFPFLSWASCELVIRQLQ